MLFSESTLTLIHSLLCVTVFPFYNIQKVDKIKKKIKDGETAYIDPRFKDRSFAEAKLVEIIPKMWVYDPDQRITIFNLVDVLRTAVRENEVYEKKRLEIVNEKRKKTKGKVTMFTTTDA
jgi:hypothetical protein